MKIKSALILTFLAGFSTVLGTIPIFFRTSLKIVYMVFKIAFLTLTIVSIFELIPDGFNLLIRNYSLLTTIIIMIISFILGFLITKSLNKQIGEGDSIYRVGLLSMIAMIMHNIPEGIITYITATNDLKLGILITFSIMLHNIPEGLLIATPIYFSKKRRGLALFLTILSGMSEFLGAIISYLFLSKYINDSILGIIYVFTAGVMIYVSLFEIYPIIAKKETLKFASTI